MNCAVRGHPRQMGYSKQCWQNIHWRITWQPSPVFLPRESTDAMKRQKKKKKKKMTLQDEAPGWKVTNMLLRKWAKVFVTQLCLTPCDHMNCSKPGSSVHGILQARVGIYSLLQGIFPTQESNLDLLHCRQILYCLSH